MKQNTLPPSIVSLGEVLWDLFPEGARFGGAPANFACHAAVLGCDVAMVSAVGDDPRGREAVGILRGYGIDTTTAAVAAGLLRGESLPTIVRSACEVAAAVCAQSGAVPECPGAAEGGSPTGAADPTSRD